MDFRWIFSWEKQISESEATQPDTTTKPMFFISGVHGSSGDFEKS